MVLISPDSRNGLVKPSGIDTFQIRSLSERRLIRKLGVVDSAVMEKIAEALSMDLSL